MTVPRKSQITVKFLRCIFKLFGSLSLFRLFLLSHLHCSLLMNTLVSILSYFHTVENTPTNKTSKEPEGVPMSGLT